MPSIPWEELAGQRWGPSLGDPTPGIDVPFPARRRIAPAEDAAEDDSAADAGPSDNRGPDGTRDHAIVSPEELAEGEWIARKLDEVRAIEARLAAAVAADAVDPPPGRLALPASGRGGVAAGQGAG